MKEACELFGFPIILTAESCGGDLSMTCFGGSGPHVGACALAEPYISASGRISAAVSVITAPGHQDGKLAEMVSKAMAKRSGLRTAAVCGIHFDCLTSEQIEKIMNAVKKLCETIEIPRNDS